MNEDIEEFLIEKKSLYQKRITRLEKQERNIHELLECEPDREDVIEDLNTVIKLQDRYNALIDFITEIQESYFKKEANNEIPKNNILHRTETEDPLQRKRRAEDGKKI